MKVEALPVVEGFLELRFGERAIVVFEVFFKRQIYNTDAFVVVVTRLAHTLLGLVERLICAVLV